MASSIRRNPTTQRAAALLLALLAPGPAPAAVGAGAEAAGRRLALPTPPGMCELLRDLPGDREVFAAQARLQEPRNTLLAVFVACDRLGAFRRGGEWVGPYALVLAPRQRGEVRTVAVGTRAEFTRRMADELPRVDMAAAVAEIHQKLGASTLLGPAAMERVGVVDRDDTAVYLAILMMVRGASGAQVPVAGAIGMTVVQDVVVSYNHYARFVDDATPRRLLADARNSILALVAANPQPLLAVPPSWYQRIDWTQVAIAGLIGGGVSGLIGLVVALMRRRRGW